MHRTKLTILTKAYNAEDYIAQTIESVLGQTEQDFDYCIRDNGSTDRTGEICAAYAKKDSRIKLYHNKINNVMDTPGENFFPHINSEYITILDADDYIAPRFIERMYRKAKENDSDITACGVRVFRDENVERYQEFVPPDRSFDHMAEFCREFEPYYMYFRAMWGKLFKTEFYREHARYAFSHPTGSYNGMDTYAALGFLANSERVSFVNEVMMFYRQRKNSLSRKQNVSLARIEAADLLFSRAAEALAKLGGESDENTNFLQAVHFGTIQEVLGLVAQSNVMTLEEKVAYLQAVTQSNVFANYAIPSVNAHRVYQKMLGFYRKMVYGASSLQTARLSGYYVARAFNCNGDIATLLSVVCDPANTYLWGMHLLDKAKKQMGEVGEAIALGSYRELLLFYKNHQRVLEATNRPMQQAELLRLKNNTLNLIDNGQPGEALQCVKKIQKLRPLDREAIYLKLYLCCVLGSREEALVTANIAKVFYANDMDMMALITDAQKIDNKVGTKFETKK